MKRVTSIDFTRGLVMIIMALDHARDFLHISSATQSPTDLSTTTPLLFFTRWITHLCAPTFVFLSGTSAWLSSKSRPEITRKDNRLFLLKRGIWLIVLEFTVINLGLWTDVHFSTLIFEVIATIGAGFIMLSLLYNLSPAALGIIGLILIFGHNLFDPSMLPNNSVIQFIGSLLLSPNTFGMGPGREFIVAYPILPWLGIMLSGFACGRIFQLPIETRRKTLIRIGASALSLFLVMRYVNVYGDPLHWSHQKTSLFTFLSFVNVIKYPPSLLFTLVTLGISILILAASDGIDNRFTRIVSVYGKTPLFYFILHLYILKLLMFVIVFAQGIHPRDLVFGPQLFGRPNGAGISLPYVYLAWASTVLLLYPLCRKYGAYKAAHREKTWLRYL